ncbi:protein FAM8A1 [Phlebotomus argentipes]|uniref:protein FAM8A1 n=1 Tax=Phlebotomus argentipes TaxID=94469 RepID=UPI002893412A|nr:protein FAM8A1 [Phlebotomus argentipes]
MTDTTQSQDEVRNRGTQEKFSVPLDDVSPKEAYFAALRIWVNQANQSHNAMAYFPYYLMSNYPQLFPQQTSATATQEPRNLFGNQPDSYDSPTENEETIPGSYEFVIAPFWKRVLAEMVDVMIVLLIKLLITFGIVDLLDIDINIEFNFDTIRSSIEDDYSGLLSLTTELLILEIVTKLAVCVYEAAWTAQGHGILGGATPGKIIFGLRVLYVDDVMPLEPPPPIGLNMGASMKALIYPATNPGFRRALFRAVTKNAMMALLFPMCIIMFFFRNNRTGYDILTSTIVVEENPAPVFRRR